MKDKAVRIRIEPRLRDAFLKACQTQDLTASQVIRAYMRRYVEDFYASGQRNIFQELANYEVVKDGQKENSNT